MSQKLSNIPYKGTNDYFPTDFQKLQYIFSIWREICLKYGYKEYLTPVLERSEIYEEKSGEDIKRELFTLTDSGERRLSLRPEMTPSVTRMVTRIYGKEIKPLKLFSIANFFRGERPQKGRDREFWQLNVDIFGEQSILADLEILMMALDIMFAFGAPESSFILKLNNRKLINFLFDEVLKVEDQSLKIEVTRKMDKFQKLPREEFENSLREIGLKDPQVRSTVIWMTFSLDQLEMEFPKITASEGYQETKFLLDQLKKLGYEEFVTYNADLIRGFDYYDGSIFEVFDLNPDFSRSVFGGGRYNGLAELFGSQKIPAVGFAPGSPISIFLDNWNLWPDFSKEGHVYFLPILQEEDLDKILSLTSKLRHAGLKIETSSEIMSLTKALSYANKKGLKDVIIYGSDEIKFGCYKVKNMDTGEQTIVELDHK